ncbi:MAG: hypothetical protein J3Q66DRAFT_401147 [Benniella sp.]|nr:MAG: hypothetical protein J3Q66DRAFT_401147 [Benniella sp.]
MPRVVLVAWTIVLEWVTGWGVLILIWTDKATGIEFFYVTNPSANHRTVAAFVMWCHSTELSGLTGPQRHRMAQELFRCHTITAFIIDFQYTDRDQAYADFEGLISESDMTVLKGNKNRTPKGDRFHLSVKTILQAVKHRKKARAEAQGKRLDVRMYILYSEGFLKVEVGFGEIRDETLKWDGIPSAKDIDRAGMPLKDANDTV